MTKRKDKKPTRDYEVGHGKPPKEHQFQPKTSGNPKGRPKGSKNMSTLLEEALAQKVTVTKNGRTQKVPARELLPLKLVQNGIAGGTKDQLAVLKAIDEYTPHLLKPPSVPTQINVHFVESSEEILLARYAREEEEQKRRDEELGRPRTIFDDPDD